MQIKAIQSLTIPTLVQQFQIASSEEGYFDNWNNIIVTIYITVLTITIVQHELKQQK